MVRAYVTGAVLMVAVVAAAFVGDRLDRSSSYPPVTGTGSMTSTTAAPWTVGPAVPSAGARSRASAPAAPVATGLPAAGQWIDYQSSEGTGRLAVTDHRRRGRLTDLEVMLTATGGYQSYILTAYDDTGYRYLPVADQASAPMMASGVISAGETLSGRLSFEAPSGPLTLVLRNDRNEDVAAVRVG